MSSAGGTSENPNEIASQLETNTTNEDQTLKNLLAETIQTMNTMMTKFAALTQAQQNPNISIPNTLENQTRTPPIQPHEEPNHNLFVSANTVRSEQSPSPIEFDPLKARIDKVEAELSKIKIGGTKNISFQDLCLFPDVSLPDNFKLPEFEKYNGEGCPVSHLRAYCGDMVPLRSNDPLLIRCFQKSLTGPALKWFTSLDLSSLTSFDQLSNLFIDQYSYNLDMEPRREDLESLKQNNGESFGSYVGRWRAVAARVKAKPTDEESINLIVKSALLSFSGYLAMQEHPDFPALIKAGSRIESAINQGLVLAVGQQPSLPNPFNAKRTRK
ncbi:hypothetical protein LUZ63_017086 [Rhynchospora breviuscula]|uniref:Retrotransposon gag domain-containing protein n=1 Tax=Rhynchospora breviuscula TaxID=2022672 RepID=A0A9Q0C1S2_9POAL|nr:hypothetical protein LUZ63_017086 [Rhynchospora breviuscula]